MKKSFYKKNRTHSKFLCYNGIMLKTKTKVTIGFIGILSVAAGVQASNIVASQVEAADSATSTFTVNVVESLNVTITADSSEATGNAGTLLREPVTLEVTSTNSAGFAASMYSNSNTNLTSKKDSIETLSASTTRSSFEADRWGYSLQNEVTSNSESSTGDNADGKDSSTYSPMTTSSSLIPVMTRSAAATGTQKVWFGTKASLAKTAGEYSNTVVFSVVSGTTTPSNPSTPAEPTDTSTDNPAYAYTGTNGYAGSSTGATVYTTTSSTDTTATTKSEVSAGDTRNAYQNAAGVTETTKASVTSGTPLATGLAVTAAVAATSGFIFFILAKRKSDDDDEEEQA